MSFNSNPNRLEAAFFQRDTANEYYGQVNISGSNLIIYLDENGLINADQVSVWATKYGIGISGSFTTGSAISSSYSLSSSYSPSITSSYSLTASYALNVPIISTTRASSSFISNLNSFVILFTNSILSSNYSVSFSTDQPCGLLIWTGKTPNGFTASFGSGSFTGNLDWVATTYIT